MFHRALYLDRSCFLFYVNDLPLDLCSETDIYADDTTLHVKGFSKDAIQSKRQLDLSKQGGAVVQWLSHWTPNPKVGGSKPRLAENL